MEDVVIEKLRKKFDDALNSSFDEVVKEFDERYLILDNVNELYGDSLNYLNNKWDKIKLSRGILDE